jgi:hypothetical protein
MNAAFMTRMRVVRAVTEQLKRFLCPGTALASPRERRHGAWTTPTMSDATTSGSGDAEVIYVTKQAKSP